MSFPFPGMNPYLEHPDLWPEIHHRLITAIADAIELELSASYRVAIEKRIYLDNSQESALVCLPDMSIYAQPSIAAQPSVPAAIAATLPSQAEAITLPLPPPSAQP